MLSIATIAVIIFVKLAIGTFSSGSLEKRTVSSFKLYKIAFSEYISKALIDNGNKSTKK